MATLALTAALTFGPVATADSGLLNAECPEPLIEFWSTCITPHAARWIPTAYREEAAHDSTSGDVATPPTDWGELLAAYFHPDDIDDALRVIQCESQFLLTADNPRSSAWGPWQFLRTTWNWVAEHTGSPTYDTGAPTDPTWSTINAAWLWYHVGPSQWTCW